MLYETETVMCKRCSCANVVTYGKIKGNKRCKCKECNFQFQSNREKRRPESTKRLVELFHLSAYFALVSSQVYATLK